MGALSKIMIFMFIFNLLLIWNFPANFTQYETTYAYKMGTMLGVSMNTSADPIQPFMNESYGPGTVTTDNNTNTSTSTVGVLTGINQLNAGSGAPALSFFSLLQPIFVVLSYIQLLAAFVFAPITMMNGLPISLALKLIIGVPLAILYIAGIVSLISGRDI